MRGSGGKDQLLNTGESEDLSFETAFRLDGLERRELSSLCHQEGALHR